MQLSIIQIVLFFQNNSLAILNPSISNQNMVHQFNSIIPLWWAFFAIAGWASSCHGKAQRFWVGELGPAWLQHAPNRLVHKLRPLC